jgi:hypothetical protein
MTLLHNHPNLARVVGIATEPPRLFKDKLVSEDMVLVERNLLSPAALAEAKKEKMEFGLGATITSGTWRGQEFPDATE